MIEVLSFKSGMAACTSFGLMMMNRWTKSGYTVLTQIHKCCSEIFDAPVGEAPAADPDALEHTVASELVHHKSRIEEQRGLVVVWHDASDEVGIGGVEGGQQLVKLGPERRGDGFENLGTGVLSLLLLLNNLLRLAGMISEEINDQRVLAFLHLINLESRIS